MAVLIAYPALTQPALAAPAAFTVTAVLPAGALTGPEAKAMRAEVTRIWNAQGVHVDWTSDISAAATTSGMVVLLRIVDRIAASDAAGPALGAVIRVNGRMKRVIYVARPALDELLRAGRRDFAEPLYTLLFGRMAGRVVAHELGHLLLDSAAHSAEGLMRARFVRADVMMGSGERFALTPMERLRLDGKLAGNAVVAASVAWKAADAEAQWPGQDRQ